MFAHDHMSSVPPPLRGYPLFVTQYFVILPTGPNFLLHSVVLRGASSLALQVGLTDNRNPARKNAGDLRLGINLPQGTSVDFVNKKHGGRAHKTLPRVRK